MNTEVLRQFGELALEEKDLNAQLAAVKAKKKALEQAASDELLLAGLKRAPLEMGITVYEETKLWAKAARVLGPDGEPALNERRQEIPDWPLACNALRDEGLGDYVGERFDVQSLSAYFRSLRVERANDQDPRVLPEAIELDSLLAPGLHGAILLSDVTTLKATRN
jgi:hypothetical protein